MLHIFLVYEIYWCKRRRDTIIHTIYPNEKKKLERISFHLYSNQLKLCMHISENQKFIFRFKRANRMLTFLLNLRWQQRTTQRRKVDGENIMG